MTSPFGQGDVGGANLHSKGVIRHHCEHGIYDEHQAACWRSRHSGEGNEGSQAIDE